MIILLLLLVLATTIALVRTISSDGYGHRPIPPSHPTYFATRRPR
jgi:hypothetical protein